MIKNLPANAADAKDVGSFPRSGRSPGVGNGNPLQYSCLENSMGRAAWQATVYGVAKNPLEKAGDIRDVGSIPGLGRVPGVGNGNPLQYSCLGNPMDRGAWQAIVKGMANSQTRLSIYMQIYTYVYTHTQK